jgi:hypothetical protein
MRRKALYTLSLSIVLCLVSVASLYAQGSREISGTVQDAASKLPLSFASVSVLAARDSGLITGNYTNDKGLFQLSFSSGDTVLVRISYLGYESTVVPVYFGGGKTAAAMGVVALTSQSNALHAVTITADQQDKQMYVFKKDTVEFNVPEDFMEGGTAQDVLEYTPTLSFDANNNLMVKGKGNVKVYVDSKPISLTGMDVQTYLQNTPSFMIEQIQILTTPPDPEDAAEALAAGITDRYYVNIITRKIRYHGFAADLTGGANSRHGVIGRARFNMNLDPFQLNYFNSLNHSTDSNYLHRTSFTDDGDSSVLDQRRYSTQTNFSQFLNGTYEFKYSDKERLRLTGKSQWDQHWSSSKSFSAIDNPKSTPDQDRIQTSDSKSHGFNFAGNADYRKEYDSLGKRLTATLDVSHGDRVNTTNSMGDYRIRGDTLLQLNAGNSRQTNLRGNVQYLNHFGNEKHYMLTGGFNISGHHNLNDVSQSDSANHSFQMYQQDRLSTDYHSATSSFTTLGMISKRDRQLGWVAAMGMTYTFQNTGDAYQHSMFNNRSFVMHNAIGMNYAPGEKQQITLRFNPGFRSYTQISTANDTARTMRYVYNNFIPAASAKYEIGDHEVRLSYNRDIDRPEWQQLNPYVDNRDPLNIRTGNPDLKPTFTDKYHLRYEYNHQSLYAAFDLEKDIARDPISSFTTVDSAGVSTRTYVNLNKRVKNNAGLDLGGTYFRNIPSIKGNFNLNAEAGMDLYRQQSNDPHVSLDYRDVTGFSSHFKMWSSVKIGFFSLIVNGRYEGPRYFSQGKRPAQFSSGLRARAAVFKRRLNCTLSVENLFGASVKDTYYQTSNYVQYGTNRKNVRYFSVYITYRIRKYKKTGNLAGQGGPRPDGSHR